MTWTRLCEFNESHWHWHGETNTMRQVEQVEQQPSIPYVVPKLCTRRMSCHRSLNETQLDHGKTAKCTRSPLSPSCFKPPTIARTGRPWIYCCLHCPTLSCPVSSYCSILSLEPCVPFLPLSYSCPRHLFSKPFVLCSQDGYN